MRLGYVPASVMASEGTFLPKHFLGDPEGDARLRRYKKQIVDAKRRVKDEIERQSKEASRLHRLGVRRTS